MKTNEKIKYLNKIKLFLLTTLLCSSTNVNAAIKEGNIKSIGNPKYAKELEHEYYRLPYEINKYIRDKNINIYLLTNTNSAEREWMKDGSSYPGNVSGFNL